MKANMLLRDALWDMLYMVDGLDEFVDFRDMKKCPMDRTDEPLCGREQCHEVGCVFKKLAAAKAALRATRKKSQKR